MEMGSWAVNICLFLFLLYEDDRVFVFRHAAYGLECFYLIAFRKRKF